MIKPKIIKQPQPLKIRYPYFVLAILVIICFGSFIIGYELVAVTMLEAEIKAENGLTQTEIGYYLTIATAMLPLGAIAGCFITQFIIRIGENKLMIISDIIVIIASLLSIMHLNIANLCAGRFIVGIACGISSSIIPPYIVSIVPNEWSWVAGFLYQLLMTLGVGFSFFIGQKLKEITFMNIVSWKSFLFIPILYSFVRLVILNIFKFDSLETHFENNDKQKLKSYMKIFYNRIDVDSLIAIKKFTKPNVGQDQQDEKKDQIMGLHKKLFYISMALFMFSQLSGINVVISYAKQLFMQLSLYEEEVADSYILMVALVQIISTGVGGWLANKYGRKTMLVFGGKLVIFILFIVFIVFIYNSKATRLLVTLIFAFILVYSGTVGLIPQIYVGELLPNLSSVIIVYWILTLFSTLTSNILLNKIGLGVSFLTYSLISCGCLYYIQGEMVESQNMTRKQLIGKYIYGNQNTADIKEYQIMNSNNLDQGNSLVQVYQN